MQNDSNLYAIFLLGQYKYNNDLFFFEANLEKTNNKVMNNKKNKKLLTKLPPQTTAFLARHRQKKKLLHLIKIQKLV